MGVQHRISRFRNLESPTLDGYESQGIDVPLHTELPFSWEFEGFGNTYCFVDGELTNNYGDLECRSPFNAQLHDRRNHTLQVMMLVSKWQHDIIIVS
jgi:hypothetical protein